MSYEIPQFSPGIFPADIDMSGAGDESKFQFTAVDVRAAVNTSGYGAGGAAVAPPPSAGQPILGILQSNPQLGEAAALMTEGISKAKISGNVSIDDILMNDNLDGNGASPMKKATTGNFGVAKALESGSSGDIIAVYLRNFGKQ